MKEKHISDALNLLDDDLIEAADKVRRQKKYSVRNWSKWGMVAACFCILMMVVVMAPIVSRQLHIGPMESVTPDSQATQGFVGTAGPETTQTPATTRTPQTTKRPDNYTFESTRTPETTQTPTVTPGTLPQISIPAITVDENHFEGYLQYTMYMRSNGNPWHYAMDFTTLPVYKNLAYDPAGAPVGLDEKAMLEKLQAVAKKMGVTVLETESLTEESVVRSITAQTSLGTICVEANGATRITLKQKMERDAAVELFSPLYDDFSKPIHATFLDYDEDEHYSMNYLVFEGAGSDKERVLNYNFDYMELQFYLRSETVTGMTLYDHLSCAEEIGEYPIISSEEAEKLLLKGNYVTDVPYTIPGEQYVEVVELVYRKSATEKLLIPYYRFYVQLPQENLDNGLRMYGVYYVPAIAEEYIADMPVYNGELN